jgi:hypothetical protein
MNTALFDGIRAEWTDVRLLTGTSMGLAASFL